MLQTNVSIVVNNEHVQIQYIALCNNLGLKKTGNVLTENVVYFSFFPQMFFLHCRDRWHRDRFFICLWVIVNCKSWRNRAIFKFFSMSTWCFALVSEPQNRSLWMSFSKQPKQFFYIYIHSNYFGSNMVATLFKVYCRSSFQLLDKSTSLGTFTQLLLNAGSQLQAKPVEGVWDRQLYARAFLWNSCQSSCSDTRASSLV